MSNSSFKLNSANSEGVLCAYESWVNPLAAMKKDNEKEENLIMLLGHKLKKISTPIRIDTYYLLYPY
ncbi:hypothetical protein GMES_1690 [Paraglaciecola mesophila KMM 241]|uniref:Uncharacterized protein n=1 Tax=Paraglaciecola mesophila KMM 241 TaxID=1128912 RepID=K6YJ25_9ALTE|nr:hypothetical protein GMES_1690 [Paraglaciecola mesophila KMM 241]